MVLLLLSWLFDGELLGKGVRVFVDFALVTTLIWGALRVVFLNQRTKAVGSALGLVGLVAVVAGVCDLRVVSQLTPALLLGAALTAGLMFQDDLRFLLMQSTDVFRRFMNDPLVQGWVRFRKELLPNENPKHERYPPPIRFFTRFGIIVARFIAVTSDAGLGKDLQTEVNIIRNACETLTKEKIGALIVMDLANDLEIYTKPAITLNAELSSALLYATFIAERRNPLHDGACVVRGMRIVAAGCILPLSSNPEIPMHFGTRHRAGIGLSEVSGAVIVVVSEETSRMTVCYNRQWQGFSDVNEMRDHLEKLSRARGKAKSAEPAAREAG